MERKEKALRIEDDTTTAEQLWDELNMEELHGELESLFPEITFDGGAVLQMIMKGDLWGAVREIAGQITGVIAMQGEEIRGIFIGIVLLGVFAAVLGHIADLFQNHQVSDIAFFLVYLLLTTLLLKSYVSSAGIVGELLEDVVIFMKLMIPTYMIAVGSASGLASAGAYYQLLTLLTLLIQWGFLKLLLPSVSVYILLAVINGIWMEEKLAMLLEFLEKGIAGAVKMMVGAVSGFSILQAMISPAIDSLQATAVQKAAAAIPGIGELTEGMMKLIAGSAVLIKNSIGIYITLLLLFICFVPILKLLFLSGALKLGAVLISLISDQRMITCADRFGTGSLLLLKIAASSAGIFIIQVAIIAVATTT